MVYIIKYQLNKPGKDYTSLYTALGQYQSIKDPGLHSVWFVHTSWNQNQIFEHLRHHLDVNDKIFIARVRLEESQGWLSQAVWSWIQARQ